MKKLDNTKKKANFVLQLFAAALTILMSTNICYGQNQITIYRAGFDQIIVRNNSYHSITLQIGNSSKVVIPSNGTYSTDFRLSYNNVAYTAFKVNYDYYSFMEDSLICVSNAEWEKTKIENKKIFLLAMAGLFHGTNFDYFVSIVRGIFCVVLGTNDCNELIYELGQAYQSSDPEEQRRSRMEAIINLYLAKIVRSDINESNCVTSAKALLYHEFNYTYYASQFFNPQEKSHIELTPYAIAGFRVRVFDGVGSIETISLTNYNSQPSYGVSLALNFNAYNKYGKRKFDKKYYIPIDYMQSRTVYKKLADSVFTSGTAYSWRFYSIGFGWEFNYYNINHIKNTYNEFINVGLITNSLFTSSIDTVNYKVITTSTTSNFRGTVPYINFGCKIKLFPWLDLYGSYYSTLLYSSWQYDKRDMPLFRQFNLGLNIILTRHISYQY